MSKKITPMFYGYIVEPEWLYKYGVENHCVPPPDSDDGSLTDEDEDVGLKDSTIWNAKRYLLAHAGLDGIARFLAFPVGGKHRHCLVLTTNDSYTQTHMPLLPIERYAKLMEILEVDEKPVWWKVG